MRHPCEPSEYQFHYDRSYLRTSSKSGAGNSAKQSVTNGNASSRSASAGPRYPMPNRDLDILFEVNKSRKPGECLANIQYDKYTGEVLSIKPLSSVSDGGSNSEQEPREKDKKKESLATQLTPNSFTRHGYNVEHLRGTICGPLPGMVTKEGRTGKHRHDPTKTTVQDHYRHQ
ncbi:uncharacterized protein LOC134822418 [Bolinopsis microptera]|uniref:uncharacterized protein LOC134822418 n=1 Tax=Bolinopsis microptera TaxID=2820187 RepID=UPI003079508F